MKRKSLLVYSLVLGGIVATGASSCSQIAQAELYNLVFDYNEEGGNVSAEYKQGYIFENTVASFTVTPNEGYHVESISINNQDVTPDRNKYEFRPVAGDNVIRVKFALDDPDKEYYTVEIIPTDNGTVKADKLSGEVGESVNLEITPDEGYVVNKVFINGFEDSYTTTSFYPSEGVNTVKVEFILEEEKPTYSIEIETEGAGTVTADKMTGYVGENVKLDIIPDDDYEVGTIIINDVERPVTTISFDPIEGENTVFVEFVHFDYSINKGLDFTGVNHPNQTDFLNEDEFYNLVLDRVEPYVPEMDRNATKDWFKSLDFYDSFAVRYGFTKSSTDEKLRYLLNQDLVDFIMNPKTSNFSLKDCKIITKFLYDAIKSLTLEEFSGIIGFATYAMIVNANTNNDPTKVLNYENHQTFLGAQTVSLNADVKEYLNTLLDNSSFDYISTRENYLEFADIIAEFIYRPFKGILDIYTADDLANLMYKILGTFTNLTDQGEDYKSKDTDYLEMTKFVSNLLDKNFFSKASFYEIVSKLSSLKDPIAEFMKIFANGNGLVYLGGLTDAIELINQNKETFYYFIKLVGRMATNVDQTLINNILLTASDFLMSETEKSAIIFTYIAKLFNQALTACNNSGVDVTALFKNSSDLITQIKEIVNSGYVTNTTEEKFDAAALVDDLIEASKKDPNSLNDSDVVRFYNSYARLINLFTKGEKITKSYSIGMSTYFKVGEESDLVVKDQEGKEVTNSVKVNGFDTSKVGYKRLELTFPDGSYYYKSYYVTNSGNYVAVSDFEATSLTSTSDINVVLYNDEKPNGEVKKLSEFENSGLDTRKAGRNYGYLALDSDYFFFDYIVK